jgi:NADH:ubiquinone oxidoreductase subunit F (NADH-binding)
MMNASPTSRVLAGNLGRPRTLEEHLEHFGSTPPSVRLLPGLEAAGLRGRGGAAFPTAHKVALLASQRAHEKIVVVNAMEGEPAAHKDHALVSINPQLVLDGAELLAGAVGAREVLICVPRERTAIVNHLQRAVDERTRHRHGRVTMELRTPPGRYIAGEESALVGWLNRGDTLPLFRKSRPTVLHIGRSPVLVDNAETHANVALIARRGPEWFRSVGTDQQPGTALVSVSGAVANPVVCEVAYGTPIREILATCGADTNPRAMLLGGYGGAWLDGLHVDLPFDDRSLAPHGAAVGAGVIVVLPRASCGVAETRNIVRWMANESARQCGPCAFGLPAMAEDLAALAGDRRPPRGSLESLRRRTEAVDGRGACRHPDGVARLVRSSLSVFAVDVSEHAAGRPCAWASRSRFATVPRLEIEGELAWR